MAVLPPFDEPEIITKAKAANHPAVEHYDELEPPGQWCMLVSLCVEQDLPIPVPSTGWRRPEVLLLFGAALRCLYGLFSRDEDQAREIQKHVATIVATSEAFLPGSLADDHVIGQVVEFGPDSETVRKMQR